MVEQVHQRQQHIKGSFLGFSRHLYSTIRLSDTMDDIAEMVPNQIQTWTDHLDQRLNHIENKVGEMVDQAKVGCQLDFITK